MTTALKTTPVKCIRSFNLHCDYSKSFKFPGVELMETSFNFSKKKKENRDFTS